MPQQSAVIVQCTNINIFYDPTNMFDKHKNALHLIDEKLRSH